MNDLKTEEHAPLAHIPEAEIAHLLRGFSEPCIAGALRLRTGSSLDDYEACLFGILLFYRPPGTEPPEGEPSGETRLREDLGLDSLSMSEAMFKIEELFDISIDNAELAMVATISDARRLLLEKLSHPSPTESSE